MVRLAKAKSFYDTFERKGPGQKVTHYCPGCGHGQVHKMIAEAIDDFGVQNRTIFCSPVGCSVFAYYYFDTGNIQCAHGRAPAVATGLRRSNQDAIVISYQGDGDLAGIGTSEIIHAANRGENITVYFINNAIYGMTGGQMAPTTLLGQRTMTTPLGRSDIRDGYPIGMSEMIASLTAPAYVERVSLGDTRRTMKTRQAVRKALKNQIEGRGFSLVEVLSPCPINWKMTPVESRSWLIENLEPVFPLGVFRDKKTTTAGDNGCNDGEPGGEEPAARDAGEPGERTKPGVADSAGAGASGGATRSTASGDRAAPSDPGGAAASAGTARSATIEFADDDALVAILSSKRDAEPEFAETQIADQAIKIAGFGGQGVLSAGVLLANCAIAQGLHATWLPSYGPEMRGGTANASVIASNNPIGSPLVEHPTTLIAMNGPSLDAFEDAVVPGGLIIVNSSLIDRAPRRADVRYLQIPASDMAGERGFQGGANVILLSAYAAIEGFPQIDVLRRVIPHALRKKDLVETNLGMVEAGIEFARAHIGGEGPAGG